VSGFVSRSRQQTCGVGPFANSNHPFVDGNKRIGHAAMEVFLLLNGHEIDAPVDEQEKIIIHVASGKVSRIELREWISKYTVVRNPLT
jgi:death on curing protein